MQQRAKKYKSYRLHSSLVSTRALCLRVARRPRHGLFLAKAQSQAEQVREILRVHRRMEHEPEVTIRSIVDFLGVEFIDDMLHFDTFLDKTKVNSLLIKSDFISK